MQNEKDEQNGKMDESGTNKTLYNGKREGSQHPVLSASVKIFVFLLGIMAVVLLEWNGKIDIIPAWPSKDIQADNSEEIETEVTFTVLKSIYVYQYDVESGNVLSDRYENVDIGKNTIKAGNTPSGYKLAGEPIKTVIVDNAGNVSEPNVGFGYEKINTNISIHVYQYDVETGNTLSSREKTVGVGNHTIRAGNAPSGYRLVSASSETVSVDSDGNASTNEVWFGYEKIPVITNPPSGQEVSPYDWSTQFNYSDKNSQAARSLSKAFDGNIATSFYYTIWQSEREDESPEITVYFSGETIAEIGIVNGKATSQSNYFEKARVSSISARIYTYSGTYNTFISVPDIYSQQYQKFWLGDTYSGVTQIDLFLNDFYKGKDSSKYEMNIADIKFYN